MAEKDRKPINPRLDNLVRAFALILISLISVLNVGKVIRTFTFLPIYLFGVGYYFIAIYLLFLGLYRLFKGKKFSSERLTFKIGLLVLLFAIYALITMITIPEGIEFQSILGEYNAGLGTYYKSTFLNLFESGTYWKNGIFGIIVGSNLNHGIIVGIATALIVISVLLIVYPLILNLITKKDKKAVKESTKPLEQEIDNPVIAREPVEVKPGYESDRTPFINENSGFAKPSISIDEMYESNTHLEHSEFSPLTFARQAKPEVKPEPVRRAIPDPIVEEVNLVEERQEETPVYEDKVEQVQIDEDLVTMQPVFEDAVEEEIPEAILPMEEKPKKRERVNWIPPSTEMLMVYDTEEAKELNEAVAVQRVEAINQILANFKVGAKCSGYIIGPSVTRYNIEYDPNVTSKSVEKLVNDISIRLGGVSARFTPIVFGSPYSGLEIPNATITTVSFKEVFESLPDVKKHPLAVAFGKDISGNVISADFDEFPHILVAGTTGSGKSIYIHSIIATLIMRVSPDDLRIVLVDPKKVEMTKYRDMPHLLCPIITEAEKAKVMLSKLVEEMENRYQKFADNGLVSNVKQYNEWALENGEETMPYIIAVLDEYADLVDTCKEISQPVVSIAQKARAAGIHLLISTQRPSTNIITGVIKGNLPTHVALMTASYVDSNVIIGEGGAEKLLGKGDMLVQSPLVSRQGVTRLQGCFIQNKEIGHVVGYLKDHYETVFDERFMDLVDHSKEVGNQMVMSGEIEKEADAAEENRYQSIKEWVLTQEFVSMSKIQRECSVGFNRAGRFFKRLQQEGVVSTQIDGSSKGCKVLGAGSYYDGDSDNIVTSDELIG